MVLIWAVFGGFLYHILLSNYLTVLIKPSYEAPVDTAQDVWDRGLIINIKIIIQASVHLVGHERLLAKSLGFYVFSQMAKNLEFVFLIPSFFIFAFL